MSETAKSPLMGVRVAEFGGGRALAYCGKLFADFGADVVKVEPPGGDPDRRLPPLVDAGSGRQESALFAWMNTNKASVTVAEDDAARLAEIAGGVDVLLDARTGAWDNAGPTGHAALRVANPGLIVIAISWFGISGPYKDYAGADAVVRALAGLVRGVGPAEAPIVLAEHQSYLPAALSGFSAALASLIAGGAGRRFEVSIHDANTLVGEFQDAVTTQTGFAETRWGRNHFFPVFPTGVYPTKDGWLGVTAFSADQWRGFCDMLGMPELVSRRGLRERQRAADRRRRVGRDHHRAAREPHRARVGRPGDRAARAAGGDAADVRVAGEPRASRPRRFRRGADRRGALRGARAAAEADGDAAGERGRRAFGRRTDRELAALAGAPRPAAGRAPARCRSRACASST